MATNFFSSEWCDPWASYFYFLFQVTLKGIELSDKVIIIIRSQLYKWWWWIKFMRNISKQIVIITFLKLFFSPIFLTLYSLVCMQILIHEDSMWSSFYMRIPCEHLFTWGFHVNIFLHEDSMMEIVLHYNSILEC